MSMLKKSLILSFAIIFVFCASLTNAQVKSEDISLTINPKQPSAGETVSAKLSSYMLNLDKALISWNVNGQLATQAVGKKDFSFQIGENGSQTIIDVKIDTVDGNTISKQLAISPADINLLWEAPDSYVPPFYKGKALFSQESPVKVVVLLNSDKSNSASYNWKLDDNSKIDSSGYGKSFYVFNKSFLDRSNTIEVSASGLLGNNIGSGKITLGNWDPKIVFYKKDLTFGTIWEQALGDNFTINSKGDTIVAEPYFISPKDLNSSDLKLTWTLGNSDISTPETKNEISIKPDTKNGSSIIGITIENIKKMFLKVNKQINVNF